MVLHCVLFDVPCCLFFAVCCLLRGACCSLFADCCMVFVVFIVCNVLFDGSLFVVRRSCLL